jgi:exopolyphosphatase/guanosine-5'-triphosphate,3'-diphosphate pyrophosphatase
MRWADINEIYVPKIGLADGLIQSLYEELEAKGMVQIFMKPPQNKN